MQNFRVAINLNLKIMNFSHSMNSMLKLLKVLENDSLWNIPWHPAISSGNLAKVTLLQILNPFYPFFHDVIVQTLVPTC